MIRVFAWIWIVGCVALGLWVLYDANKEIHGDMDPNFCTDCEQFKHYLEDVGG